jgi:radical SAM protein with 4Fe4S-binding SPASM domain
MSAISDRLGETDESVPEPSLAVQRLRPLQVTWEMTRECEWKPTPARRLVRSHQRPRVSTAEAFHLIEEIVQLQVPLLALTGGDALLRPDLLPIIEFAAARSVRTALTVLPTPRADAGAISELKAAGLMRVGFWLHGSTAALHDAYWAVPGSYRRTLELIGTCNEVQLPVQVNTVISRRNFQDVESMLELLTRLDVAWWNAFLFVPASKEQIGEMLNAEEHERIFAKLYAASKQVAFHIKTTEGQHYQRYILQQRARESRSRLTDSDAVRATPRRVDDSRAFVFIDHTGEVYPSRFLPIPAGNLTSLRLTQIYRDSSLFISLRDPSRLKGKCGVCPFCRICGGSRARAYAVSGKLFAAEPCCAYEPH